MKHTKLLVVALLVALLACLAVNAMADETVCPTGVGGLHNWAVKEEGAVPATCTTQGVRLYVCQNTGCGASKVEYTNPLGHAWGEYKQIKDATCSQPGVQQQVCTRCGHYSTENIRYTPAATGKHEYQEIAAGNAATCTVDGMKPLAKCIYCGAIDPSRDGSVAKATGHNFNGVAWEPKSPASCLAKAKIQRKCLNCDYYEVQETGELGAHVWGDKPVIPQKDPTCTATGCKAQYQCSVCGAYKGGEVIDALGHDLNGVAWTVERESTCVGAGSIVRICRRCLQPIERQAVAANGQHKWTENPIIPGKEATCTTTGCKPQYQCTVCGALKGGEEIPALGHKFSSWTTEPATCTKDGKSYSICSECGHVSVVVIPATGHSATWTPKEVGNGYVVWALHCGLCNMDLATQVVNNGEKAPSGTVNTGKANVDINYTGISKTEVVETAKKETKKTTTAKKATNTTTAKKATTTATAPKTEAVATEIPSAELKINVTEYKVGDVTIKLDFSNFTYTADAELAEGETVALFVDADALAKPAEGNFVALSAEEATELPEGFVPTLVAIVKEADLPVATASK